MQKEKPPLELKRPLPADRTYEQVRNHYEVEKEIADRLRRTTSIEERKPIFATMYDELFAKVPDHPRLTRRESPEATRSANLAKFRFVEQFIDESTTFAEFAPGDCRFLFEVSRYVSSVYGIDISDQIGSVENIPDNFNLIVYDGYRLDLPDETVDVLFSDQLIEHFHPDDTKPHFQIAHRILKKGGVYMFQTPHRFVGPSDVSQYFSDEPEGFHLKEWTYTEIASLLREVGFSSWRGYWSGKGRLIGLPQQHFYLAERGVGRLSPVRRRKLSRYLLPTLVMMARK